MSVQLSIFDEPPMFAPRMRTQAELWRSEIAAANRQRRVDAGESGTIVGLSRKADAQRSSTSMEPMRRDG